MTEVVFHIANTKGEQAHWQFACLLLEKMYAEQERIYVHLSSQKEAQLFDNLLWTYQEDSFIPHELHTTTDPNDEVIQLGYQKAPNTSAKRLVNLSHEFPSFYTQFSEVIEIVFSDPLMQQLARERYQKYREQGLAIRTIKHEKVSHDSFR